MSKLEEFKKESELMAARALAAKILSEATDMPATAKFIGKMCHDLLISNAMALVKEGITAMGTMVNLKNAAEHMLFLSEQAAELIESGADLTITEEFKKKIDAEVGPHLKELHDNLDKLKENVLGLKEDQTFKSPRYSKYDM